MTSQRLWAYHNGGKWFGLVQVLVRLSGRGWVSYGGWPIGAHGALGAIFSIYSCKQITTDDQDKCNLEPAVTILDDLLHGVISPCSCSPLRWLSLILLLLEVSSCKRKFPPPPHPPTPLSPSTGHWVSSVCWSSLCSIVGLKQETAAAAAEVKVNWEFLRLLCVKDTTLLCLLLGLWRTQEVQVSV